MALMIFSFLNMLATITLAVLVHRKLKKPEAKDPTVCSCKHGWSIHTDTGMCGNPYCYCHRFDGITPAHIEFRDMA